MTTMEPSKYQYRILEWVLTGKGSTVVQAVAGSGKTTTLILALSKMAGKVIFMAFSKKIANEIARRVAKLKLDNINACSMHAAGRQQIVKARGKYGFKVDGNKCGNILDEIIHSDPTEQIKLVRSSILRMVTLAKDSAFGVEGCPAIDDMEAWQDIADHHDIPLDDCDLDREMIFTIAITVLKASNAIKNVIDFSDMIYHVLLFDLPCIQYDWVLIDEAQDTNATRRLLAAKLLKPGGRLMAVGDDAQAIMGFTGADVDSMDLIAQDFNAESLPLSICYRCGTKIVEFAKKYVPHIEAAPNAIEGEVIETTYDAFMATIGDLNLTYKDGIICRNNAPLVPIAFSLIRKGIPCRIEGKDIVERLTKYTRKWKDRGIEDFFGKFNEWIDKQIESFMEKKNSNKVGTLEDDKNTMNAIIEHCMSKKMETVYALRTFIEDLFIDSDGELRTDILTLSSVHKSKGLEWDNVYVLGFNQFMPSPYATKEWMLTQEDNLKYVAITRAKSKLVMVEEVPKVSAIRKAA